MLIKAARIVAWLLIAAVIFLSIGPQKFRPYTGIEHELEHFLAFSILGLAFGLGYPGGGLILAILGIAIAGALETAQLWVPHRHAYFSDFIVNCESDFTIKTPGATGSIAEYLNSSTDQAPIIVSTDNEQNVMAVMLGTNDGDLLAYWNKLNWVVSS